MDAPEEQSPAADLDSRTIEIGRHLFALARKSPSRDPLLDRLAMEWSMKDERVKAQLFRLVDVLPVLTTPERVNRHLREYLGEVRDRLPFPARHALNHLPQTGLLGRALSRTTHAATRRMARRFIAGTDPAEAAATARRLRARRMTFTLDVLGEAVLSDAEAIAYQQYYLQLIDRLAADAQHWPADPLLDTAAHGPIPKVNVSVKLSALYSQFDPIDPEHTSRAVRDRLRPILRLARSRGVFINVDMEQHAYKDTTLRIFKDVLSEDEFKSWPDVGIAVQAYLTSSGDDLRALARWAEQRGTPVWVRLVKGAYWDYERIISKQNDWPLPVYATKPETDANYEAQAAFLIDRHDTLRPAIASHNIRSIASALAHAESRNLPNNAIEFQMLYGMADPIKDALIQLGHRVRIYTPVGALLPGMAYLVRRLLENTSNESFLRAGFLENVPEERLLMNPLKLIKTNAKGPRDKGTEGLRGQTRPSSLSPFSNEPPTDFSREDARASMHRALAAVRSQLGRTYPLVIAGQRIDTAEHFDSINPSNPAELVGHCAAATPAHAESAVAAARSAFPAWRDTPPADRAALLLRLAARIRARRFELAAWEVFETAKPWREADGDVAEAIDFCEYYAREAVRLAQPWGKSVPGEDNDNLHEPRGVAVVIAPWNFPLAILTGMTTAALVMGNTVVIKPAEQSTVIGAKLMELLEEAGAPAGVANLPTGDGELIGPTLTNHPDVSIIAFTGSRKVGLLIQEQAARTPDTQPHLKRVITEMGGKNAVIVDEDADLDEAVLGVAHSAFGYAGQKCSAASRVILLAPIHDAFVHRLIEVTKSLHLGPAEDPKTLVPPVIDAEAHARILKTIEQAKQSATLAHPVETADSQIANRNLQIANGYLIPPHIFTNVAPDSPLAQDEIFGPVLAVLRADNLTHALELANGTRYALTGGLYSRSPATIARVKKEFRVGNLYINRKTTGALVERQPFGGYKLSGIGTKAGGPEYLQLFTWPRTITENTMRRGFTPPDEDTAPGAHGSAGGL